MKISEELQNLFSSQTIFICFILFMKISEELQKNKNPELIFFSNYFYLLYSFHEDF